MVKLPSDPVLRSSVGYGFALCTVNLRILRRLWSDAADGGTDGIGTRHQPLPNPDGVVAGNVGIEPPEGEQQHDVAVPVEHGRAHGAEAVEPVGLELHGGVVVVNGDLLGELF